MGAGQMGLGIAYVAALRAKVPVMLLDRSKTQVDKGAYPFRSRNGHDR